MRKSLEAGFTLIELLVVVGIIGVIAAVAAPGLIRARIAGNEASAIASLRVVNSSQQAYMSTCGNGFFASSLVILGDPAPAGAAFISPDLGETAVVNKSGYRLTLEQGSEAMVAREDGCNPSGTAANLFSSYVASNQPLAAGLTGTRWFWTNTLGAVYVSSADDFDASLLGNTPPSVGNVLQ